MGKVKVFGKLIKRTEGAVAVITAMGIIAFIGMVSLAIDMGHLYTVRNELQNVADASALAAAGSLIKDDGTGVAVRDAAQAQAAAMQVAQRQSQLSGQTAVGNAGRNDLTIIYGTWNINAGNPSTAWTAIGSTCGSNSNANAVQVKIARAAGTVYGPVSNFFGGIMGLNTSQVQATAIAYLGYTSEVLPGAVQVPLALPSTGPSSPLASNGHSGWFARLFGPDEAVASATKTVVFKDTGGTNVNATVDNNPTLDSNHGYFYTLNSTDSVPDTILNTLAKIYTPSLQGTTNVPVLVGDLKLGQAISARSEFKYGKGYIGPIFQNLQKAYYYKTTGNASTAPAAGTAWHTTLVVYGMQSGSSLPRKAGFMSLARLLAPFWPSEAYACYTVPPPQGVVKDFVNADITGVTYNTSSCDDCSYTFPHTISGVTYTSKLDCLTRYSNSTWNTNTVTIKNVTDASTVPPVQSGGGSGTISGGQSTQATNPAAPANVGSFASSAKLVK